MVLKARNAVLPVVGAALVFQAASCKKDKDSNTDLLVGEWNAVTYDGAPLPDGYKITFEFQSDKDMQLCSSYGGFSYCYDGGWDWANSDEDEVDLDWKDAAGDDYTGNIQIESLSKDELKGEFSTGGDTYEIVLEKVK